MRRSFDHDKLYLPPQLSKSIIRGLGFRQLDQGILSSMYENRWWEIRLELCLQNSRPQIFWNGIGTLT